MREVLEKYLEKPSPALWDQLTSEEQRYVEKLKADKKSKGKETPKDS
jgi:hypothetical protein